MFGRFEPVAAPRYSLLPVGVVKVPSYTYRCIDNPEMHAYMHTCISTHTYIHAFMHIQAHVHA